MESRFSTWLYRITYNRAIDCRRSTRLSRPHVDERVLANVADASDRSDPYAAAAERQRRIAVQMAVDSLPDLYRSALYLFYWMERSIGDIAELLSVPEGTVKSYLYRGRHALEARLRSEGFTHV
jgi:RNA polymerase sigma-70 factor (ECF subfamily)